MSAGVALTDTSCLTAKTTQIIKFRTSNTTLLHQIDVIDDGCVKRKDSFDANTETRFSHSYRFARATMFAGNHHSFKCLESFLSLRLFDPYMYADRIARLKPRNVLTQLRLFNSI